jgi:hypothetical protein
MKLTQLSTTVLTIATLALPLLPAQAATVEQNVTVTTKTEIDGSGGFTAPSGFKPGKQSGRIIPAESAIVVGFPNELSLDASKPTTHMLQLAQPIYDADGEELLPVNSYINAQLKPTEEGIEIIADAVMVKGRKVALKTTSVVIPGQSLTIKSGMDAAQEQRKAGSGILGSLLGGFGMGSQAMEQGMMLGNAGGWISGLGSGKKVLVVKIPRGTVHLLSTTAAVTIP